MAIGTNPLPAQSTEGQIWTSSDGLTWQGPQTSNTTNGLRKIRFMNGRFIAVGYGGAAYGGSFIVSTNGVDWSMPVLIPGNNGWLTDVAFGNSTYVFTGSQGTNIVTSSDLSTFLYSYWPGYGFTAIAFGDGKFIAVGSGTMMYSSDGLDWRPYSWGYAASFSSIVWTGSKFLVSY